MAKLYFKYGAMGSSKSANALMCKFNYEQKGMKVLIIKTALDQRDLDCEGNVIIKSRIGLSSPCKTFTEQENLKQKFEEEIKNSDVIIVDECHFLTEEQVEQLKEISFKIPVLCYGLKTNFQSKLFTGSKRLLELADSIAEIKSVCSCGSKAIINARLQNSKVLTSGDEVLIGGDNGKIYYEGMCYKCWLEKQGKNNDL